MLFSGPEEPSSNPDHHINEFCIFVPYFDMYVYHHQQHFAMLAAKFVHAGSEIFLFWQRNFSMLAVKYFQAGREIFPSWQRNISKLAEKHFSRALNFFIS